MPLRIVVEAHASSESSDRAIMGDEDIIATSLYCYHSDEAEGVDHLSVRVSSMDESEAVQISLEEGISVVLSNDGVHHCLRSVVGTQRSGVIWLYLMRADAAPSCA